MHHQSSTYACQAHQTHHHLLLLLLLLLANFILITAAQVVSVSHYSGNRTRLALAH